MTLKEAFFKDLAHHVQIWRDDLVSAIADPASASKWAETAPSIQRLHEKITSRDDLENLRKVLDECFRGILHSTLVTIDGGTSSGEIGSLALVDADTNEPLTSGALHEEFADYLAAHDMI